jgi:aspartyl-tRNA(Asn)/glutamyl-tRNA(Gln) amidotransferase subunit A
MYLADIFTVQASVAGIPAISVPMGKDERNMPFGLQIMAGAFREDKIFAFSNYLNRFSHRTHVA